MRMKSGIHYEGEWNGGFIRSESGMEDSLGVRVKSQTHWGFIVQTQTHWGVRVETQTHWGIIVKTQTHGGSRSECGPRPVGSSHESNGCSLWGCSLRNTGPKASSEGFTSTEMTTRRTGCLLRFTYSTYARYECRIFLPRPARLSANPATRLQRGFYPSGSQL